MREWEDFTLPIVTLALENNINCVYKEKYQFSETLITV